MIGCYVMFFQLEEVVCLYVSLEKCIGQYIISWYINVMIVKWMYMMVYFNVVVVVGFMVWFLDEYWQYGCLWCVLLLVSWVWKFWLQLVMIYGWFFQEQISCCIRLRVIQEVLLCVVMQYLQVFFDFILLLFLN